MNAKRRIQFFQQIATMARAGVPLSQGLPRIASRLRYPEAKYVAERVAAGDRIVQTFAEAGFDDFELNLIDAGERSGKLEVVFERLAEFWRRERELADALRSKLMYPMLLLNVAVLVSPAQLIALEGMSAFLWTAGFRLAVLYAVGFLVIWGISSTWRSPAGQAFWLHVPIIGGFWKATYAYRWVTSLRMLYTSGIPIHEAVEMSWAATGFAEGQEWGADGKEALLAGEELGNLMTHWYLLPRDWADFAATAEYSGKLEDTLNIIEQEAIINWQHAERRLGFWIPKLIHYAIIIVVIIIIFSGFLGYMFMIQEALEPLNDVLDAAK